MSDADAPTPDGTAPAEAIDPALLQKALARIQAVARGNGVDAAKITPGAFEGGVYRFTATVLFQIKTRSSERRVTGKENGEVVAVGQMQQLVDAAIDRAARDPGTAQHILAAVKKRPDRGFGASGITIGLDALSRTFVSHLPCSLCGARGTVPCAQCNGRGEEICPACHGQRDITCPTCRGQQYLGAGANRQTCQRCSGRGRISCNMCQQAGQIACRACKGAGTASCGGCAGTGWQSVITHVEVAAQGWFDYEHIAGLPARLRETLRAHGPEAVTGGHIRLAAIEAARSETAGELPVVYQAAVPWGRGSVLLATGGGAAGSGEGEEIPFILFGAQAALSGVPPFLEKPLRPGREALRRAAAKGGNCAREIRAATRYRLLAETVAAAARFPAKKAAEPVLARYPFGIGAETVRALAAESRAALAQLTQRPRRHGLLAGLALAALLYAGFFFTPARAAALVFLQRLLGSAPAFAEALADAALFAAGALVATFAVRFAAARVLHSTLGPLLRARRKGGRERKHGTGRATGMAGACLLGCALLFLLACAAAMAASRPAPGWFAAPVARVLQEYRARRNAPSFEEQLRRAHEVPPPPPAPEPLQPLSTNIPGQPPQQ